MLISYQHSLSCFIIIIWQSSLFIMPKESIPLWKVDLPLLFLPTSLIVSPVILIFANSEIAISFFLVAYLGQVVLLAKLLLVRRTLYGESRLFLDETKRTRCVICRLHPVSKKYHLRQVHKLEKPEEKEFFKSCGCEICQPPRPTDIGVGGF